jgi:hypothetical protein
MLGETGSTSLHGMPFRLLSRAFVSMRRGALGLLLGCAVLGTAHAAMDQRGTVDRTVEGKVTDKGTTVLKGAVVYLKNDHTMAVKSFIVDDAGNYRFGQLSQSTDYELWAEIDGKKSSTRAISSFDNKNAFVINLKIDTGK